MIKNKIDVAILMETRISGLKVDNIVRKLGFAYSHRIEAMGFFGGIWILWRQSISIQILLNNSQFVHLSIEGLLRKENALIIAVYASPNSEGRLNLWKDLSTLADNISTPWLSAGDFNAILQVLERKRGAVKRASACTRFKDFVFENGLHDLGYVGPEFTWNRGSLYERLDRGLCSWNWLIDFRNTIVSHLLCIGSDRRPLLLSFNNRQM